MAGSAPWRALAALAGIGSACLAMVFPDGSAVWGTMDTLWEAARHAVADVQATSVSGVGLDAVAGWLTRSAEEQAAWIQEERARRRWAAQVHAAELEAARLCVPYVPQGLARHSPELAAAREAMHARRCEAARGRLTDLLSGAVPGPTWRARDPADS